MTGPEGTSAGKALCKRKRAETDSFTVSFLDVASCGFGAMIILLMIVKPLTLP